MIAENCIGARAAHQKTGTVGDVQRARPMIARDKFMVSCVIAAEIERSATHIQCSCRFRSVSNGGCDAEKRECGGQSRRAEHDASEFADNDPAPRLGGNSI